MVSSSFKTIFEPTTFGVKPPTKLRDNIINVISDDEESPRASCAITTVPSPSREDATSASNEHGTTASDDVHSSNTCSNRPIEITKALKYRSAQPQHLLHTQTSRHSATTVSQYHQCVAPSRTSKSMVVHVDQHVAPISAIQVNLIESLNDEGVDWCNLVTSRIGELVTKSLGPTYSIYHVLLGNLKNCATQQCESVFNMLQRLLSMHPLQRRVPFPCVDLIACLNRIQSAFSVSSCGDVCYNELYLLRFYVDALQTEFTQYSMASQRQISR